MGVAVSSWQLARRVSTLGHLGVVSGTALDVVLARRLQQGDLDGSLRRALAAFPDRAVADGVLERFFVPGGKPEGSPFKSVAMFAAQPARRLQSLATVAGFAEVFLARENHDGLVGINFLEKVQLPTPAILYGALLAGVDYLLVGAGIPRDFPDLLDRLTRHEAVRLPLHVTGALPTDDFAASSIPLEYCRSIVLPRSAVRSSSPSSHPQRSLPAWRVTAAGSTASSWRIQRPAVTTRRRVAR